MKTNIVGVKELRKNLETYINRVKRGDSYIVVKRSKPVLKLSSPDEIERWETVADFTAIKKGGISAKAILKELRKLNA